MILATPAVYAATTQAKARPISNPANLVVFGAHMPALGSWLLQFGMASIVSIVVTYFVLRRTQRAELAGQISIDIRLPTLSRGGRIAGAATTVAILVLNRLPPSFGWSHCGAKDRKSARGNFCCWEAS